MNKKILLVVGATIASIGFYSASSTAATVTANASANVLAPLTLTAGAAMDFGDVAAVTGATSTVVLLPDGTTSSADGATIGGTTAAGAFTVTGDNSLVYDIVLPASIMLTGGTGSDILVDTFTDSKGGSSSTTTGAGTDAFTVGATLNLGEGQGSGTYTGNYSVTINYQ